MWDLIKDWPFSIEVWKVSTMFLLVAVAYLSKSYKDYDKLRNVTDAKVNDLHGMVKNIEESIEEIMEAVEQTNEKMVDIRIQYEKISLTIDKFINVITTTDEIGVRQKEQLDLLNEIIQNFRAYDICNIKETIEVTNDKDETINLKKLLDMICDEYELHKKE